jgi:hypothetical protein
VYWDKKRQKWRAQVFAKGKIRYGEFWTDDLEAAKRVNQLCEKWNIKPPYNPEIKGMPIEQPGVTQFITVIFPVTR